MENLTHSLGDLLGLIKYPSVTEKSINLYGDRQYAFVVDKSLSKTEIKYIIEKIFNVTITNIRTCVLPIKKRKMGKTVGNKPIYKKAYVKLKEGDSITELFN